MVRTVPDPFTTTCPTTDPENRGCAPPAPRWSGFRVRDDLRGYVLDEFGHDACGMFVIEETGFVKKGT
jgi:hypothetical protein